MNWLLILSVWTLAAPARQDDASPSPEQVQAWVQQLGAPYYEDRQKARAELDRLGKTAEPQLIFGLASDDFRVKRGCIELLGKFKSRKAVSGIGKLFMDDPDESIRISAFRFLKDSGQASGPYMIKALELNDEDVRLDAIQSLAQNRSKEALPVLAGLYRNRETLKTIRDQCFEYLLVMGDQAGDVLMEALKTEEEQRKLRIISRFRETKYAPAAEPLASLLEGSPSDSIQTQVLEYLEAMGVSAEPHWIKLIKHGKSHIRIRAVRALGQLRSDGGLEALAALVTDQNQDIRHEAEDAIVLYGQKGMDILNAAVKEGRIAQDVVDRLRAGYDEREVIEQLERLIANNTYGFFEGQFEDLKKLDRRKALDVLVKIVHASTSPKADKSVLRRIQKSHNLVLGLSLMALGELGEQRTAVELKGLIEEADERIRADRSLYVDFATTLYRLGDRSMFEGLIASLEEGAKNQDPYQHYDSIFFQGVAYNRVGLMDKAEAVYRRIIKDLADEKNDMLKESVGANAWYNLSCVYSLQGKKKEAIEALKKAVEFKYTNADWMERDGDLKNIRDEEEFQAILKSLRGK